MWALESNEKEMLRMFNYIYNVSNIYNNSITIMPIFQKRILGLVFYIFLSRQTELLSI